MDYIDSVNINWRKTISSTMKMSFRPKFCISLRVTSWEGTICALLSSFKQVYTHNVHTNIKGQYGCHHQPKSSRNLNIHGQTTNQHIHVTLYVISNYTPVQMIQQSKPWQETVLRIDCEITIENWSLLYPTTGIRGKQTQTRRKIMKKLRGKRAGKIMTKKLLQIIRRRDFLFFGGKLYGEKKDKIFYA